MALVLHHRFDLWQSAGQVLIAHLSAFLRDSDRVVLFLSGGSCVHLYPALIDYIRSDQMKSFVTKLAIAQVDERFRPGRVGKEAEAGREGVGDKDVNAQVIGATGLWQACLEREIPTYLISQDGPLQESVSNYNQTISNIWTPGTRAVAVLGIGEDGHTAGLLPGLQSQWEVDRLVVGYNNDGPFPQRISLTPMALKQLDFAIVVAGGDKKRPAVNQLSSGAEKDRNRFPAAIFYEMQAVEVITDQDC